MKTRIIGAVIALVLGIAGTVLLVTYVRGADARAAEGAELVDVYVVGQEPIPLGTPGEDIGDYIDIRTVAANSLADDVVKDLDDLTGQVASAEVLPGEQIVSGRFVSPETLAAAGTVPVPAGLQEVTVTLPVDRVVGGAVRPGSTVGVVVTAEVPSGEASSVGIETLTKSSQFVYHGVLVTRVQQGAAFVPESDDESAGPVDAFMVTFAVQTAQVEKLVWAQSAASIWLTLEPEDTDISGSRPVTNENVFQ